MLSTFPQCAEEIHTCIYTNVQFEIDGHDPPMKCFGANQGVEPSAGARRF